MARGSTQATTAGTSAQNLSNGLETNSNSLYGALAPELQTEAAHPAGYSPTDLAEMNTAAQQSAGGSQAGAVGEGSLLSSRTKNAGTADAAIADSARSSGEALSKDALDTQLHNADLKQHQQQAGLSGLEGLYGTDLGGSVSSLGQVAGDVNANTNAASQSWDWAKYLLDPAMQAAGSAAGGYLEGKGCWIAEAIYGIDNPRTHLVRAWLNGPFKQTVLGSAVMWTYVKIGRHVASVVRRSNVLRRVLEPLFDLALGKAVEVNARR